MLKKKYVLIFISIMLIGCVAIGLSKSEVKSENLEKYLVIQEELVHKDTHYVKLVSNLSAVDLGEQIGVTDLGQQVYKIKDQDEKDWVCLREDGMEWIFRNRDIQFLTIDRFKTNKIVVKEDSLSGGEIKTILQQDAIDTILADLKKENLSNFPESVDMTKKVNLYSEEYPGLYFSLYYLHNSESGTCFLYDANTDETWTIGHEFMKQLM